MATIYRYQTYREQGPNGTTLTHNDTDNNDVTYLGRLDGYDYISLPDGVTLPEQPPEIGIQQVTDAAEIAGLRQNLQTFKNSRELADAEIHDQVGNPSDLMADLAKRIGMVERLVMRMAKYLLQNQDIPAETRDAYLPLVNSYIEAIDVDGVRDRVDLEDNVRIAQVLISRFATIADIVNDIHISKVKEKLGE